MLITIKFKGIFKWLQWIKQQRSIKGKGKVLDFLLFWRILILYSVLVQILLSSCEAVVPSCSLQYREKPET